MAIDKYIHLNSDLRGSDSTCGSVGGGGKEGGKGGGFTHDWLGGWHIWLFIIHKHSTENKKLASLVTSIFGHWMALFCFPSGGRNVLWRGRVRFLRRLSRMCALHRHAAGTASSVCKKYLCLLGNCSYLITVLLFNVLVKLFNSDFGGSGTSKRGYSKKVVKWQTWVS